MEALAVKYRPQSFDEMYGQESIVKILMKQVALKQYQNAYLFCGISGTGKTTAARILAKAINNNCGNPIEIDAASNSGVDNIRSIIADAQNRSIDSEYKIFIIDECHALSNQAWQAFLKCIEEPPTYTIFILCTTEPQKIPETIKNRVQQFNFTRISADKIKTRLLQIANFENFVNAESTIDYISKTSNGCLRQAIASLEKCASYNLTFDINESLKILGNYPIEDFFIIINALIDDNEIVLLNKLLELYNRNSDLKFFTDQLIDFTLDLSKYL